MTGSSHERSHAAYKRAIEVMPGGNTRSTVYEAPHPIYAARGTGAYVQDIDGNEFLDLQNNFTALIHGHCHGPTVDALRDQAMLGTCFGHPTVAEIDLAELLCERVPWFDRVRFTNTGSEAVLMAVKAARALTGRPRIAKCEGAYHGNSDVVEVSFDPTPANWGSNRPARVPYNKGTPPEILDQAVILPFNDVAASEAILEEEAASLAAVIIDPMPSRAGLIPASPDYLAMLRRFTERHGIVLVADEVLNFRMSYRGALAELGFEADLCTFGKIVGGGLPVGALAGRAPFMAVFDPTRGKPPVSHSGTFTANPMTMRAGLAAMRAMTPEAFDRLNALGDYARAQIKRTLDETGTHGQVTGRGSLFIIHLKEQAPRNYREAYPEPAEKKALADLVAFLKARGFSLSSKGMGALSTPMNQEDIDRLCAAIRQGLTRAAVA